MKNKDLLQEEVEVNFPFGKPGIDSLMQHDVDEVVRGIYKRMEWRGNRLYLPAGMTREDGMRFHWFVQGIIAHLAFEKRLRQAMNKAMEIEK
jgi:hypothetical protein